MASSKVVINPTPTTNPEAPLHHPPNNHPQALNRAPSSATMIMDDLLKNIISDDDVNRSVDDVWKEIVDGGNNNSNSSNSGNNAAAGNGNGNDVGVEREMTLEDFLIKGGGNEGVMVVADNHNGGCFSHGHKGVDSYGNSNSEQVKASQRRKRRGGVVAEEAAVIDKATQQKQRRMIKNRESAARSRERKQAYTAELESLVTQLEEENARLLREEAEQRKERLKQLVENLIPVAESQRPRRALRRINSMQW